MGILLEVPVSHCPSFADSFWKFPFHIVSISRLSSDVLLWKPHARNLCATAHVVEDGNELRLSSSVRVRMEEFLDGLCRVHSGQLKKISGAGNHSPSHV